jgi:hypothetical protein
MSITPMSAHRKLAQARRGASRRTNIVTVRNVDGHHEGAGYLA